MFQQFMAYGTSQPSSHLDLQKTAELHGNGLAGWVDGGQETLTDQPLQHCSSGRLWHFDEGRALHAQHVLRSKV